MSIAVWYPGNGMQMHSPAVVDGERCSLLLADLPIFLKHLQVHKGRSFSQLFIDFFQS